MSVQTLNPLVAEFIKQKVYTFSSIRDHPIPKSLKCSHSATKARNPKPSGLE